MKSFNIYTKKVLISFTVLVLLAIISAAGNTNSCQAKALKIRYNKRNYNYNEKQIETYLDGKKIDSGKTKSLLINNSVMVPYTEIIKKGCKIKTTYTSKTKKIKFVYNGITIKLTVGSKNMYVNGKKKKLNQAPLLVKYIKANKTKVLVPAKDIFNAFGHEYVFSSKAGKLTLKTPFYLYYNKKYSKYTKNFGGVIYNNILCDTNQMPVLLINNNAMIPAEQIFKNSMGCDYTFNPGNGSIVVKDKYNKVVMTLGSKTALVNNTPVELPIAPMIIRRTDNNYECVMVPAKSILTAMDYYYSLNKTLNNITIHTKNYFNITKEFSDYDKTLFNNSITGFSGIYDNSLNSIVLNLTFENPVDMNTVINTNNVEKDRNGFIDIRNAYCHLPETLETMNTEAITAVSLMQYSNNAENYGTRLNLLCASTDHEYKISSDGNILKIIIPEVKKKDYGLKLIKPDNVNFESIKCTDDFNNKKYVITLPGNHKAFYDNKDNIVINSKEISGISANYSADTESTNITITTKKIQGFKLVNLNNTIAVIVDDPNKVFEHVVVLDPGHGGKDPGAKSNSAEEAECNYSILYKYGKKYFSQTEDKVKVYYTRTTDVFIPLSERANYASTVGAELFVSLHMNSANSSAAKGTEVYYSSLNNSKTVNGYNSADVATLLNKNIVGTMKTTNRGVKTANYYVIRYNSVPAILIELGFITNSSDRAMMTSDAKRNSAAEVIYNSIMSIFE